MEIDNKSKPKLSSEHKDETSNINNNKLGNTETFSVDESHKYYNNFRKQYNSLEEEIKVMISDNSKEISSNAKEKSSNIEKKISQLKEDFQNNSMFLVAYDRHTYLKSFEELDKLLNSLNDIITPKKKFKFSSKAKNSIANKETETNGIKENSNKCNIYSDEDLVLKDVSNKTLILKEQDLQNKKNLIIENVKECKIYALFAFKSFFAKNILNSHVYVGSVSGGSHVTLINDSEIYLGTHQMRIHESFNTIYSILVNSNPIIEHCSKLKFIALDKCIVYPKMNEIMKDSGLDFKANKYENIQDFQWLKQEKSPNFEVILDVSTPPKDISLDIQNS